MTSTDTDKGKLYICATPIGNLGDITLRVLEVLKEADLIAAEDTRNSVKLLNHFDIHTPMTSYHEFNRFDKADELVDKMLHGTTVALITDAGTPCISDPGEVLVDKCIENGIEVHSLPGPSAVITALTLSGFAIRRFVFEGFLPSKQKKKERAAALSRLKAETGTMVLYEAPHHLKAALEELSEVLGKDRRIALCRELTKKHEEVLRMTLEEALLHEPRGEYVLVIEGRDPDELEADRQEQLARELSVEEHMQKFLDKGVEEKEAMRLVAKERGVSKRDIYNALKR